MKWSFIEPSMGDVIRVSLGTLYHFGIYVSDSEVIQFGLPPTRRIGPDSEVEVLASDIDAFLAGGFLEVCEYDRKEKKKLRSPEEIVNYARSKIGTRGYNILYNNCEHFANECAFGEKICRQAEDVRALFRNMPIVDVYIARLPLDEPVGEVECKARREEIAAVSNERVKREKYFVWKLLCYGLERSFGLRGKKLDFSKESFGGWSVSGHYLSISHSENALAVAVSRDAVGIDVELLHTPRSERMAEHIMNDGELSAFEGVTPDKKEEHLIEIWTAKEAIFKSKGEPTFIPSRIDTLCATFKSGSIDIDGEKYIWSVATKTPQRIRIFSDIDLTKIK